MDKLPFSDLVVIDLSTVLAGPSVGTFFAELGAKVIKFENPRNPDVTRSWKLPSEDKTSLISAYFSSVNYGKEYLPLDLSKKADLENLFEKIKTADILLSNFKFGDEEKFGITAEFLEEINPTLIWGKISGFGENSDRVAYDLILQAETGFMSMNGTEDSGPVKMPVALIDVLAAHQLKEGLLLALLRREKVEKLQVVNVSLYDAAICSLANQASNYLMEGHVPQRIGSLHPNIAPYGELFRTKDDQLITFAIGTDRHFSKLCSFFGLEAIVQSNKFIDNFSRVKNRLALQSALQERIACFDCDTILNYCHSEYIPAGKVKNLHQVLNAPETIDLIVDEKLGDITTKRVSQIAFKIK